MFTIKHVCRGLEGTEASEVRLWEGRDVRTARRTEGDNKHVVSFTMEDGAEASIDNGVVFVMNRNGKTVQTFTLEDSEWFTGRSEKAAV